ncbi:hypothetical protein [Patulibacter americanus]|uniref:hypothetical protein n=1 Tax=Patulibacter americanus TaxID=588672 RepID=UPI0003B70BB8|nr:hypothetical protein [Patulibacter americanus]
MIQPEPTNARFVGGPLDGETHLLAHRLPFVQMPGPDEAFFARLHIDRPDAPDHLLYELDGAEDGETLIYRCRADAPAAGDASPDERADTAEASGTGEAADTATGTDGARA